MNWLDTLFAGVSLSNFEFVSYFSRFTFRLCRVETKIFHHGTAERALAAVNNEIYEKVRV